jgi:hypothetical protein
MVAIFKSPEAAHKLDFHTLAAMADEAERHAKWEKAGGESLKGCIFKISWQFWKVVGRQLRDLDGFCEWAFAKVAWT